MSRKKKKNPAAEDLIESLMKDLKESSSSQQDDADKFLGHGSESESAVSEEAFLVPQADLSAQTRTGVNNLWKNIESGLDKYPPHPEAQADSENAFETSEDFVPPENFNLPKIPRSEPQGHDAYHESHGDVAADEIFGQISSQGASAEESFYRGPSAGDGAYQSADDIFGNQDAFNDRTKVLGSDSEGTLALPNDSFDTIAPNEYEVSANADGDKTLAVSGFANAKVGPRRSAEPDVKVSVGQLRGSNSRNAGSVFTNIDASLAQADNLKLAQQRLLELENEVEKLREENEELASAGEIIRTRADEYSIRIGALEKQKGEQEESHQSEVLILKGNLQFRESEMTKARLKIEELDARLKSDFKKIRVRERELENRLELVRAEKAALVQSKDDYIMDLKRKIDQLQSELDNYRSKVLELNKTIDSNQEQFKRTVRALRLALSNLEVKEENVVPFKKAE